MKVGICDYQSSSFDQDLLKSVINTGFAVITNHDIDHSLVKDSQKAWKEFFKSPQKVKNLLINGNDTNMGYKGIGTETAVGANVADLKEFYHWKPGEALPYDAEVATTKLFYGLNNLGKRILSILSEYAGGGVDFEADCDNSPITLFRALYYPALKALDRQEGAVRSAAHEDINHITLLVAASAPGLQVKDVHGNWHDVPHEENSITVNIGDMLQLATKGLFKSTTHRVVNPPDDTSDRISIPLFIHPHPTTVLSPGFTAAQYLKERIDQIYGKK